MIVVMDITNMLNMNILTPPSLADIIKPPIKTETIFYFPESAGDFESTGVASHDSFPSTLDGDPIVLTYDNFTINTGHTVTTTNRCKGLYLYIKDDLIVNGALSMTARGAKATGKYVITDYKAERKFVAFASETLDVNTILSYYNKNQVIYPVGGVGSTTASNPGVNGACGAGGFNYCYNYKNYTGYQRGGSGSSFSGGAGAGGGTNGNGSMYVGGAGSNNGGAGGAGGSSDYGTSAPIRIPGGGAGNPGGTATFEKYTGYKGADGTGGLLILVVDGNINIVGSISSNGSKGGDGYWSKSGTNHLATGGSGSGGGAIHIFYRNNINNTSKITVAGGAGGTGVGYQTQSGKSGGTGTINLVNIGEN